MSYKKSLGYFQGICIVYRKGVIWCFLSDCNDLPLRIVECILSVST